jgi:hypothetical protein
MSEAKYWEEYDEAKKAALKMAAKLSAREKGLMVRALHCDMKDEAKHDRTRQRLFEQSMVSLDRPDENGDLYDYGDCNRAARRMFREIDAPVHEHFRRLRLRQALYRLRKYPELQATLKAIYKYRFLPRQKIFSALKIRGVTYRKRLSDLTQILKIST